METFVSISKRVLESLLISKIAGEAQTIAETAINLIVPFVRSLTGV